MATTHAPTSPSPPPRPAVGAIVHFRHGPLALSLGHAPCSCLYALVTRHEEDAEDEEDEDETIALALKTPHGWHIHHTIRYAPLPACDVSGTWHPADEHDDGEDEESED